MDVIGNPSLGHDIAVVRASEIKRQSWFCDPRDLHATHPLHQLPSVNGIDIAWDHTDYRYQWERDGLPVSRPLTCGGPLSFNKQNQWWERNGISWQPEKKSQGGRQTTVDLRHLGVVVQPRASRFLSKAKTLLRISKTLQADTRYLKKDLQGVLTIVSEVSKPEIAAEATLDLAVKSHVLYTPKQPFRFTKSLHRNNCRHPSTCCLHPHVNVDAPQTIDFPLVDEPEKFEAAQSGFTLRPCKHMGHEHLAHEQDPCFSDAKEEGIEVQTQEDAIEQVLSLAAIGADVDEVKRIWQQEEERERQREMLMSLPMVIQKENRPPSVSAQTLFHNAAKCLQESTNPSLRGGRVLSFRQRATDTVKLRGGSTIRRHAGKPLLWRIREFFTGIRKDIVAVWYMDSDGEAGIDERQGPTVPELRADDIDNIHRGATPPWETTCTSHDQYHKRIGIEYAGNLVRREPNKKTYFDDCKRPEQCEHVGTLSDEARQRFDQFNIGSGSDSNSVEIVREENVQREPRKNFRQAYTQGRPGTYLGPPADEDPRTRREWAEWDGRTHPLGANVFTRSPHGASSDDLEPYVIDRAPRLRGGADRHYRFDKELNRTGRTLWGLFAGGRLRRFDAEPRLPIPQRRRRPRDRKPAPYSSQHHGQNDEVQREKGSLLPDMHVWMPSLKRNYVR